MGCGDCGKKRRKNNNRLADNINISQTRPCITDCNFTVTACGIVYIPNGFVRNEEIPATVGTFQSLSCCVESCLTQCTAEICPGETITSQVEVQEVSLKGLISYVINIPINSLCPEGTPSGHAYLQDCVAVNNVVCHIGLDQEFTCPEPICEGVNAVITSIMPVAGCQLPGGAPRAFEVNLEFTLPNVCEIIPPPPVE